MTKTNTTFLYVLVIFLSIITLGKNVLAESVTGTVTFDYSNNNGQYEIGIPPYNFVTDWSKSGDTSIHTYNDHISVDGVGLALNISNFEEIGDGSTIDMSSRSRTPREGEFVVLKNNNGYYAALKIIEVKDRTRNDLVDELTFEYVILTDKSNNFSQTGNIVIQQCQFPSNTGKSHTTIMLGENDIFTLFDNAIIFGSTGSEILRILGAPDAIIDSNIEKIEFSNTIINYKFSLIGNILKVSNGNSAVATITTSEKPLKLTFEDGSVDFYLTGLDNGIFSNGSTMINNEFETSTIKTIINDKDTSDSTFISIGKLVNNCT